MLYSNKDYKYAVFKDLYILSLGNLMYEDTFEELAKLIYETANPISPIYRGILANILAIDSIYYSRGNPRRKIFKLTIAEMSDEREQKQIAKLLYFIYATLLLQVGQSYRTKLIKPGKPTIGKNGVFRDYGEGKREPFSDYINSLYFGIAFLFDAIQYFARDYNAADVIYSRIHLEDYLYMVSKAERNRVAKLIGSPKLTFYREEELIKNLSDYAEMLVYNSNCPAFYANEAKRTINWLKRFRV